MADTAAHFVTRVLPRASYRQWVFTVPKPLRLRLARDPAAFATFAHELRAKLTNRSDADALFVLSMLDALDEKWRPAVDKLDRIANAEPDHNKKLLRDLTIRVWARTRDGAFRARFAEEVDRLPPELVKAELPELRAMANVFTAEVCRQLVEQEVGPRMKHGTVTLELAHMIVFQRYAVVRLVPVAKDIDTVLASHGVEVPK